jgi:hypothetical protein
MVYESEPELYHSHYDIGGNHKDNHLVKNKTQLHQKVALYIDFLKNGNVELRFCDRGLSYNTMLRPHRVVLLS